MPDYLPSKDRWKFGTSGESDFSSGGLNQSSRVRPNRLFTADEAIIVYRAGKISNDKLSEVISRLIMILPQA